MIAVLIFISAAVVLGTLFGEYEFDVDRFNEESERDRILLERLLAKRAYLLNI